jgi:hypothetical protein
MEKADPQLGSAFFFTKQIELLKLELLRLEGALLKAWALEH